MVHLGVILNQWPYIQMICNGTNGVAIDEGRRQLSEGAKDCQEYPVAKCIFTISLLEYFVVRDCKSCEEVKKAHLALTIQFKCDFLLVAYPGRKHEIL
eukprot:13311875-Ditylum_brightwellii.AAC.2